jgi:hypothetical protein
MLVKLKANGMFFDSETGFRIVYGEVKELPNKKGHLTRQALNAGGLVVVKTPPPQTTPTIKIDEPEYIPETIPEPVVEQLQETVVVEPVFELEDKKPVVVKPKRKYVKKAKK